MQTESPRAALGQMAREAFDAHDLPLFDQAYSEALHYDGTIANAAVRRQLERTYVFACVFCGRWRPCVSAEDRAALVERGWCYVCDEDDLRFARRRLRRFTELTTGGAIARSAAHWTGNEGMLERHRRHYRRCETIRRQLEAAFAEVEETR